ncbi:class I SAM-dependent methyltransferase [Paraburkholderia sediminicola]|uniref:class I SAM-dependent methyltransferase n=1 Tax=Paraburkholderia sediminicola TaxID=458836 RepID=UPI0038B8E08D
MAVDPETLGQRVSEWKLAGLAAAVVAKTSKRNGYASSLAAPVPGEPSSLRVAVGREEVVERIALAYAQGDVITVGRGLGYPACCCDFFRATWVDAKLLDTTWPMSRGSGEQTSNDDFCVECGGVPLANILWRWMGVRAVPHLPCRFDCAPSISLAEEMLSIGRTLGFHREIDDILSILSWPIEWSALHGIAEVKTPILKFVARTDATAKKYRVRFRGTSYPEEGASGIAFPYRSNEKKPDTSMPIEHRISLTYPQGNASMRQTPRENGFASCEAMDAAHAPLVCAASDLLNHAVGNILDLGCGNGKLLKKIGASKPSCVPYGIDIDTAAIQAAHQNLPEFASNFVAADIWTDTSIWTRQYELTMIGVQRLDEVDDGRARAFLTRLITQTKRLLIYAYADCAAHKNLMQHAARLGLELHVPTGNNALVSWGAVRPV